MSDSHEWDRHRGICTRCYASLAHVPHEYGPCPVAQLAEAKALLRELESSDAWWRCPICRWPEDDTDHEKGHAPDCRLKKVLG
jgi:hypothetical protein